MPDDSQGVNIPVTSSFDPAGTDATAAGLQKVQAEIDKLKTASAAASAPIAPPVSVPGAPAAVSTLKQVEEAGTRAAKNTETAFNEASHSADEFVKALKLGVGINVGEKIVEGLAETIGGFKEAIAEGVAYQKEIETLGIGLAAALKQAEPERYDSFNDALKTSGELLDVVKAKALELNVSTTRLAHTLQVSMLALSEGGIKDLNAQVETTGLLMQAAAAKGVQGFTAVRDIIDVLNGRADRVQLGRELGISNEDIAQAKQAGTLAEYLTSKLGAYRDAAKATGESLAGLEQRFENLKDALKGEVASPIFDAIKTGLKELDDELAKPDVVDGLRSIGFEVAGLVHTGADLITFCVQNAGALKTLAEGTLAYSAALAAIRIKDLIIGLGAKVLGLRESTAAVARETVATAEDTVATEANTKAKLANAEASKAQAAGAAGAGGGTASAALGIGGALNVGILAGTALAAIIEHVGAEIDAATRKENEFGEAVVKANKSLIEQVRNAHTPAEQDAARQAAQERLVKAALDLGHATDATREGLESIYRTAQLTVDKFDQQVGSAQKQAEVQKQATAEAQKEVTVRQQLADVDNKITAARQKAADDAKTFAGDPGQAEASAARNADVLRNLAQQRDALQQAVGIQAELAAKAQARADAEAKVSQALKTASAELDKQSEQDRSKTEQARDYAAALDEVTRRITQDTGLRKDEVEAIHSANDAEQAGLRIGKEKADVLAGYIPSLIDARNALDKANDAAGKEQSKLVDKIDAEKDGLGQINQRLEDQRAKLADIATKRKDVENGTVSVRDKQERLTQLAQQEKDARENINRLLDTQKQKTADLAADEAKRKAANEAAHPDLVANRDANQRYLDATKLTLDHPEHSPEEIENRRRAQQYIDQDNAGIDGKTPPAAPAAPARDLADPSDPRNSTSGYGDSFNKSTPPVGGNSDAGTVLQTIGAFIRGLTPPQADGTSPDPLLRTGVATQGPLPGVVNTSGDGSIGDFTKGAGNLDDATGKANDAAGKLVDATGKLAPALDDVKGKLDDHSKAYRDGLQRISDGLTQNVSDLAVVVDGNTSEISALKSTIFQMQLRLNNVANNLGS